MSCSSISPIRVSRTPLSKSQSSFISQARVNRIQYIKKKQQEISIAKQEKKNTKEMIVSQKNLELKLAREKVLSIKQKHRLTSQTKNNSLSVLRDVKSSGIKQHFQWISEVEKIFKTMDEQENKLLHQLSQACGIRLKNNVNKECSLTSRSNF